MIKSFFPSLNQAKIKYMLISGQAAVLYGAATFSEDIDLWVAPEGENWKKFIQTLRKIGAKVYKATPPLKLEFVRKGHGFHFEIPARTKEPIWFLDVMGVVPRVGAFQKAWKNVEFHQIEWGRIPVIGLRDLAELKKTRRLEDYAIISNLVRNEYEGMRGKIKDVDWRWILSNSFEVQDIIYCLKRHKNARRVGETLPRRCLKYCLNINIKDYDKNEKYLLSASKEVALEIEKFRSQDRIYWHKIINELKELNRKRKLLNVGDIPDYQN